ncbi:heme-binding protein [Rhodococcus sp. SGAir0479]|uniref:heme-binding protein n=1 Tax=Rhodococcus sp. SGAir0479 TaxID=2567884 RepID=UPI0010CD0122|nr:heme-binding protein [Rhodococcus sp. SGAir0479]QCQ93282.1 heme-binding protein [Rhodococcus sp. SGAir0479]
MAEQRARLDLAAARHAVEVALEAARRAGNRVSVAVVDTRGHDILVVRDDGAAWFTAGVARAKAATAALVGIPTTAYSGLADAHPALAELIDAQTRQSLTTLPGGLPVVVDGEVVGGLGVSGAQPEQDVEYAQAAVAAG